MQVNCVYSWRSDSKTIELNDESIIVTGSNPYLFVKTATVYWNYTDNVFTYFNNVVLQYGSAVITLAEGYYTYDALVSELGINTDITLEAYKNSGKCSIIGPTDDLKLGRLGELAAWLYGQHYYNKG